ncbi:hypothetical protein [Bacillus taeanensis]|uniref:FeS cluster biogenesis domain-containing protein n=1 Tax=Bacillus taeanensis TaxID=273032 RepID=A0A366XVL6_9BACI|nr:hypothetical protein [Bacillus taeanensis]RBW68799.1 hypothetical protein DS031_14735 [Bacillus taeanensis]
MYFEMTKAAANFYKEELGVQKGEAVRFFVRGGEGFFFGVRKDECEPTDYQLKYNEVTFFIKPDDAWLYDGKKLVYQADNDKVGLLKA